MGISTREIDSGIQQKVIKHVICCSVICLLSELFQMSFKGIFHKYVNNLIKSPSRRTVPRK